MVYNLSLILLRCISNHAGIYLEFDAMLIGVCSIDDKSVVLNPSFLEMSKYSSASRFFAKYSTGIVVAPDQDMASNITAGLADVKVG